MDVRGVRSIVIQYETVPEALAAYIPDRFELIQPVVSVGCQMNAGVEWMAGGSYNLIGVNVPVIYRDQSERAGRCVRARRLGEQDLPHPRRA